MKFFKPKIKVVRQRPEVTEGEIRKAMNFDEVLRRSQSPKINGNGSDLGFKIIALVAVVALIIAAYFTIPSNDTKIVEDSIKSEKAVKKQIATLTNENKFQKVNPVSVKITASKVDQSDHKGTLIIQPSNDSLTTKEISPPKAVELKEAPLAEVEKEVKPVENKIESEETISESKRIYIPAEPVEGYPHLYAYLNTERKYPAEALKDSTEGVVRLRFKIDSLGNLAQVKVVHSLSLPCDNEAIRLIKNMGKWKPARLNGEPTSCQVEIPITFVITRKKSTK